LAAGRGKRLGGGIQKSLSKISNGKTVLDFQVEKLGKKIGFENIVIVIGYNKEIIMHNNPNLLFVYNKRFKTTNTSKSWLAALKKFDEDILLIDGDVYFDEKVLPLMFRSKQSSLLVNKTMCNGEETKYHLNRNGFVHEISKDLTDHEGESLGIRLIRKKELSVLKKSLEIANDNDYGDEVLGRLTKKKKIKLKPVFVGKYFCKGINYKKDLEFVKKFLRK